MTTLLSDHDLTHRKINQTREDVRLLHPLLQLIDPEQDDLTQKFTEKLITFLMAVEKLLESQTTTLNRLTKMTAMLDQRMQGIEKDLKFLVGEPEHEDDA